MRTHTKKSLVLVFEVMQNPINFFGIMSQCWESQSHIFAASSQSHSWQRLECVTVTKHNVTRRCMMAAIDDDVEALGEKVCRDPRYTESTIKKFFDYYYLASFFLLFLLLMCSDVIIIFIQKKYCFVFNFFLLSLGSSGEFFLASKT